MADKKPATDPTLPWPLATAAGGLMGAADAVPGVSGGTIALVVGVYDRLLASLGQVLRAPWLLGHAEGRRTLGRALGFLVPLGLGVAVAWFLTTRLLVGPQDDPGWLRLRDAAPLCYAFFFGLVVASLAEPWRRIPAPGLRHGVVAVVFAALCAWFVGLPHQGTATPGIFLVVACALALGVMLLPGISGSLLLLILGQYTVVTGAVHDRAFGTLGLVVLGLGLGLVTFVPALRWLLRHHRGLTLAALTGLMAGSLRALWPWKAHYEPKLGTLTNVEPFGTWAWTLPCAVAGALAVVGLRMLERRIGRHEGARG